MPNRGLFINPHSKWSILYLLCQSRRFCGCSKIKLASQRLCPRLVPIRLFLLILTFPAPHSSLAGRARDLIELCHYDDASDSAKFDGEKHYLLFYAALEIYSCETKSSQLRYSFVNFGLGLPKIILSLLRQTGKPGKPKSCLYLCLLTSR